MLTTVANVSFVAISFYRLVPFLSRDAVRKRGLCCRLVSVSICPSVCLSDTFVYCIQTAEDTVKLLSRPGSPTILVF